MQFTFDPAKDASNRAKHGVSLDEARHLDWERVIAKPDTRLDYGELRQIGYGPIGRRLYCIVFVDRGDTRRIISLRKANNREIDRYEAEIDRPTKAEEAKIDAGIAADSDTYELSAAEFARLRPVRGRPRLAAPKQRITIRVSPDILAKFKAAGAGWQTRMDAALRDWLKTHRVR